MVRMLHATCGTPRVTGADTSDSGVMLTHAFIWSYCLYCVRMVLRSSASTDPRFCHILAQLVGRQPGLTECIAAKGIVGREVAILDVAAETSIPEISAFMLFVERERPDSRRVAGGFS